MKKVFWGVLLAMAGLPTILQLLMLFLLPQLMTGTAAAVSTLLLGLLQALGYYLIMTAAAELPGGNWEWAYKLSKILCAYTVAVAVVQLLPLSLPSVVSTILFYVTDYSSFLVLFFIIRGVADLQYVARRDLYAAKIHTCFTAWVLLQLVGSFISLVSLAAVAAYIYMLVLLYKAAKAYDERNSSF